MPDAHDDAARHNPGSPGTARDVARAGEHPRHAHTSEGHSIDPGVARDLSELARDMQAATDPHAIMQRIVDATVAEIAAAAGAAITLVDQSTVTTAAHSNDLAARVGSIASRTGQGPCVDTARHDITLRSDDLATESRWPLFSAEAAENGVLSVLSFQLFAGQDSMGALDVYSDTAHAFDDDAENIGLLLASHAAIALSGSRTIANLYAAVESRDLIGQAKGILMERFKIDAAQAFDLLILSSNSNGTTLRHIAQELTAAATQR